jgi:phage repressor protein C with HTH and peptisase S24 domain
MDTMTYPMPELGMMKKYGDILRQLIEDRNFKLAALARESGVSRDMFYKAFRWEDQTEVSRYFLEQVSKSLGFSNADELDLAIRSEAGLSPHMSDQLKRKATVRPAPPEPEDHNIQPYSEINVPEIPTYDLPIAAGPWMELPEVDDERDLRVVRDGRFRIRIRGDSMEKVYPDESLIEFRILTPDRGDGRGSRLEIGADYYVQRSESATFKRLLSFDNEKLTMVAINKKKYPKPIPVLRTDINRMAKAEYVMRKAGT